MSNHACPNCGSTAESRVWEPRRWGPHEARIGHGLLLAVKKTEKGWEWCVKGRAHNAPMAIGLEATAHEARRKCEAAARRELESALAALARAEGEFVIQLAEPKVEAAE